ncbi:hypothetical protein FACS1894187_05150 [Synergistales bacterium]|nr:hypothetical protein FACS1894187_05150 [Synergistales bacterium]
MAADYGSAGAGNREGSGAKVMGTQYYYRGDVIGVESWSFIHRKRGVVDNVWIVMTQSTNKQVAPKTLVSTTKQTTQDLLDVWSAKRGLDAVVEDPEPEAEGETPGKRVPVGALESGKSYFLHNPARNELRKLSYCGDRGNGIYLFRDRKKPEYINLSADKLTHYEICEAE